MARKAIGKIIKDYKKNVEREFPVQAMFLFGSHALDRATPESDIDLIVVSRYFERVPGFERLILLSKLRRGAALKTPMDVIGLTPQELASLRQSQSPYWRDILAHLRTV